MLLGKRDRAVNESRRNPAPAQRVYLIFHQGNQRGDNDRDAIQENRRQLIAKRLAAAGWHDNEDVVAGENLGDDLALWFPKFTKPEVFFECLMRLHLSSSVNQRMKKYNGEEGGLLLFFVVLFKLDPSRSAIAAHNSIEMPFTEHAPGT